MVDTVLKIEVDAQAAAQQLRQSAIEVHGYQLESAIACTVDLIERAPSVHARLATHLDSLLAEQLRQVTAAPLPVIE